MNRVRAFFVEEATECLDAIRAELLDGAPDAAAVYGAVRRLRGSAQVARYGGLGAQAWTLEQRLKPVARGWEPWDDALMEQLTGMVESLARRVAAVREGRLEQDAREPTMDEQGSEGMEPGGVVPIETLEYRGEAALERARALREPLERAIIADEPAGPILEELFDLIRLASR